MDWERIGLGHPALDVAITVPGLPSVAEFELAADAYRSVGGGALGVRQLVLAKLWTCIEILSETPGPGDGRWDDESMRRRREPVAWLAAAVPDWLSEVT